MQALFQQNKYCQTYEEMRNVVFNTQYDLKDLRTVDKGKCVDVTNSKKAHWVARNKCCNVYIGVFTTSLAVKVIEGDATHRKSSPLYDDSVTFVVSPTDADSPLETILRDFSNDLVGKDFTKFLALGEKTYRQVMIDGEQRIVCKGIPKTEQLKAEVNM